MSGATKPNLPPIKHLEPQSKKPIAPDGLLGS